MKQGQGENNIQQQIRSRAYAIWESEGRPTGSHEDHWRRAEREIQAEAGLASPAGQIDADRAADAAPGPLGADTDLTQRQDQLLDEAIEETFPGSDPIAPKRIT